MREAYSLWVRLIRVYTHPTSRQRLFAMVALVCCCCEGGNEVGVAMKPQKTYIWRAPCLLTPYREDIHFYKKCIPFVSQRQIVVSDKIYKSHYYAYRNWMCRTFTP